MGFYPVEVLINDAKRHGVPVLPVDVNRSRFRTTTEWRACRRAAPDGAASTRRRVVVRHRRARSGARDRWRANGIGYGIRLGLPRQGHRRGEGRRSTRSARRAVPLAGGPRGAHRAARGDRWSGSSGRAPSTRLDRPRRELLWQLRELAGAVARPARVSGSPAARSTCACRPRRRPTCRRRRELERLGDGYAILSLDARRQVVELFRPALDRLGAIPAAGLTTHAPGPVAIGGLVVTRQHPMTAKGTVFLALEDETGMVNVTLWPDAWAPSARRRAPPRAALRGGHPPARDARGQPHRPPHPVAAEVARALGGPPRPEGVRQLGPRRHAPRGLDRSTP